MKIRLLVFVFVYSLLSFSQEGISTVDSISLANLENGKIHRLYLEIGKDFQSRDMSVPVIIAKGNESGPVLGLTAAIHGNELNGIAVIHKIFENLDPTELKGILIAFVGLNLPGIDRHQREYLDGVDLNRIFPGKADGNRSEQIVYQIAHKVLPLLEYQIDLHTASFGRVNTLYSRGDMADSSLAPLLKLLEPDIIVSNKGKASSGSASGLTMRAYALSLGIKSVTVEYGNPQVYQEDMIERGAKGIQNIMAYLGMTEDTVTIPEIENVCSKSYWVYTQEGGFLEVLVDLNQKFEKGESIAIIRDSFGTVLRTYKAPESGIVVGKSTNPIAISGSRIIHLGILAKTQ